MFTEIITDQAGKKKVTGKLGVLFIVGMVVLTFFSNTINNFTLPRIEAARPTDGSLIKEIYGEGTVAANTTWEEYIDTNLRVKEIMAELGDKVNKGQAILSLDVEKLKLDYLDEQARLKQSELSLAGAMSDQEQKQRDYDTMKVLYDNGAEAEVSVQKAARSLADAERNCQNIRLNLEIQARKVERLAQQVKSNGVYTAPAEGIITELNFTEGEIANNTMPLFTVADPGQGFRLIVPVADELADYVKVGDKVNVNILSLDKKTEGKIARIAENSQNPGQDQDLWVELSIEGLTGGEKGEIYLSKKTKQYPSLVPNNAVYTDSDGSYIFVLRSRKGPLGTENYVQRLDVNVEDSDSEKSALADRVMDEVVIQSNKSLLDGDKVLKEAAD